MINLSTFPVSPQFFIDLKFFHKVHYTKFHHSIALEFRVLADTDTDYRFTDLVEIFIQSYNFSINSTICQNSSLKLVAFWRSRVHIHRYRHTD